MITAAVIACQALEGTATVDSGFDNMSMDNPSPVMTMSCSGGKLDGWGCDGTGDSVMCGTIKLATPGTGGRLPTVDAVVLRPDDLPTAKVAEVDEPPALVVEETVPETGMVEETTTEPVADPTVADLPTAEVGATAPVQTSQVVDVTLADDEER